MVLHVWVGCKDRSGIRSGLTEDSKIVQVKDSVAQIDYHEMINIVLDTFNQYNEDRIIHVKYNPVEKPIPARYQDFLLSHKRLNKQEKDLAIKFLTHGIDDFEYSETNLSEKSQKLLQNIGKETEQNLTYHYTGFRSNEAKDLVVASVGAIRNNESYSTKNSGASLIVFFKRDSNDEWKLSNFITTIEY